MNRVYRSGAGEREQHRAGQEKGVTTSLCYVIQLGGHPLRDVISGI